MDPWANAKTELAEAKTNLYKVPQLCKAARMLKKFSLLLSLPLLMAGCTATFTNLTPQQQVRNGNNLYPVEVALTSRQQSLRWDSIRPQIAVGNEFYKMRPTPLMTNRWEGLVPVSPGSTVVHYRYKFEFDYNKVGGPGADSAISPEYTLKIVDSPDALPSQSPK